ncbi:uncharacterized protein LOC100115309 isoform X2 [Nasonia vitripennis]|uniref:DDE Tnp4 domain-containing protein n=1 Tax=Nasonia vitripennis TaxID=7425 RepID=A0A7M7IVG5_NASVI|nr:uncharacterized protein LOC100115309 isoform X2 [Nasonia vitripennis]
MLNESELDKENTVKKMKVQKSDVGCATNATLSQSRSPLRDASNHCDTLSTNENENVISDCESIQNVCNSTTNRVSEVFSRPNVTHKDKAIQPRSFYRSKYAQCEIRKPVVDSSCSPIKKTFVDKATSPIAIRSMHCDKPCEKVAKMIVYESSSTSAVITSSQSEYQPSSDEKVEADKEEKSNIQMKLNNMTNYLVHANPKMHLGIANDWLCELIRPSSVSSNEKLSKEEALETKRIASLRIHIERVIRRLREFSILQPCANLSSNYIKHLDSMVIIAAALSKLQSPIIKT